MDNEGGREQGKQGEQINLAGFVAFNQETSSSSVPTYKPSPEEHKSTQAEEKTNSISPPAPPAQEAALFPWRQAGRAQRWQPLPDANLIPLWLLQFGTAIALMILIREMLKFIMASTNYILYELPFLEPFQPFYRDPTRFVIAVLVLLAILSPWLLDGLLRFFYGFQPLSIEQLSSHSPEAVRVLQRYRQQRRCNPILGVLPTSAPIALSYGNLPRTTRIVVSQGLLEQLENDEIATIYAAELGHVAHWDLIVMSLVTVVTQLPYTIYWQVSQLGDRLSNSIWRGTAAAIANLAYCVWWILSQPAVYLSQIRIYYSDRFATEMTGNPNGLTRALLKMTIGIAEDIKQQGQISWLLESWNPLISVGYRQSITLGSVQPSTIETALAWDCINPYRYWRTIHNSHPLISDRLLRLMRIAQHWHLESELNLFKEAAKKKAALERFSHAFLLQFAPVLGVMSGFAFGSLLWLIGAIAIVLGPVQLAWMYGDWLILKGCLFIGFSIGTLLQINFLFPEIKVASVQTNTSLSHLLAHPNTSLLNSQPIRLTGKILGRTGISNWLGQDLLLLSPTGLVKLIHLSSVGYVGNFFGIQSPRPSELVGRHLVASGWFRHVGIPWLELESLSTQSGKSTRSAHPIWSTLVGVAAALWGVLIILAG